jgi:hypothetical protein
MGVSEAAYMHNEGEPGVDGEVQGKADVPSLWGNTSDTLLKAHAMRCKGLTLHSPDLSRSIKHHNICFVDDNNGLTSADHNSELPAADAKEQMNHSAQRWNNLVNLANQTIAFHKTSWQLLAWQEKKKGELSISDVDYGPLTLKDHKGGRVKIEYLPPNRPNVGLGYRACPNGDQTFNYNHIMSNTTMICNGVASSNFPPKMAHRVLYRRLLPKNDYTLKASYLTCKQSHQLDKLITNAFLPSLKLNRNMPRAVVFGPVKYGGMSIPDVYTRQTQLHAKYLIQQLRWDKTVANDFLVTLSNLQLESGFVTPLLESNIKNATILSGGGYLVFANVSTKSMLHSGLSKCGHRSYNGKETFR